MSSLTKELTILIQGKPISPADERAAALFTLDAIANMIAGRNSPQGEILSRWADKKGALDVGREAFLMGALTHILEVDDLHKASVTHPGCVVVPAAWAVAREKGASGNAFLRGILWGFEAMTRVGMAVGPKHYEVWHNTATCGPFGSAAAAGTLLGLEEEQLVHALGNAGTQSSGLWEFLETGAMSKHLHAGRAAESGILAAELASEGFTGPPQILEGQKGFLRGLCPDPNPGAVIGDPDHCWQVHETSIKPWPSCRHTHPVIDACTELRERIADSDQSIGAISSVSIEVYQAALNLCDNSDPITDYEAKFSLQHTAATALSDDQVTFDSFSESSRRALAPLRSKVSVHLGAREEATYPGAWGCRVEVILETGEPLVASRDAALGDPEAPLTEEQLKAKAAALMRHGGVDDPADLIDSILALANDGPLPSLAVFF